MSAPTPSVLRPCLSLIRLLLAVVFLSGSAVLAQAQVPNVDSACGATGDPLAIPIHEVQGPGESSPLKRRRASVEGVVTAAFQGQSDDPFKRNLGGFYLHTLPGQEDDDPMTSEGIFVQSSLPVTPGRIVRASGTVMEEYDMTVLTAVREVLDCGASAEIPEPVMMTLPFLGLEAPEPLEAMPVVFPQALVVSEYFNFDRFGEIVLSLPQEGFDRPIEATQLFLADDPMAPTWRTEQELRRITLDDGGNEQNPTPVRHPDGSVFTVETRFRGGDHVEGVQGILHYAYNRWRVHPTAPAVVRTVAPAPASPPEVGGDLQIAVLNVRNYFVDFGVRCGPDGDMECRGADDATELRRQEDKIVAAILAMNPDVMGLVEIQNAGDDRAVRRLTEALNDASPSGTWAFIAAGAMGTDAISQGIVYQSDRVTPVGVTAVLDEDAFVDPRDTGLGKNRPALAQAFAAVGSQEAAVTVVVNHFKSKGSECGRGDDDLLQGSCNGTRSDAAAALLQWLDEDPTGTGAPWLIMGDLNAYPKEDPVQVMLLGIDGVSGTEDDAVDLVELYQGPNAYTFVFDGRYGRLDHMIAHPSLAQRVTGAATWAINTDEVDLIDSDTTYKGPSEDALYRPDPYRVSDHDPVIIGITLP